MIPALLLGCTQATAPPPAADAAPVVRPPGDGPPSVRSAPWPAAQAPRPSARDPDLAERERERDPMEGPRDPVADALPAQPVGTEPFVDATPLRCAERGLTGDGLPADGLQGLRPARPIDWADVVDAEAPPARFVMARVGMSGACATATDAVRCHRQLAFPPLLTGWMDEFGPKSRRVVAWTSGDEVGFATTPGELRELLAPIDTIDEAVLVLSFGVERNPYWADCADLRARAVPEGFELVVESGFCGEREHLVRVRTDGTVRQLATRDPGVDQECTCGFGATRPHDADSFDAAIADEERLAARALASDAVGDWQAYLDRYPWGPRRKLARDRLRLPRVGLFLDRQSALEVSDPRLSPAADGAWELSAVVHNGGAEAREYVQLQFEFLDDAGAVLGRREIGRGPKGFGATRTSGGVEPGRTERLAWSLAAEEVPLGVAAVRATTASP